jgi:hypothetical protein|tara:strand:- start:1265 stop:1768 length:504 start_codon:yes stop_codon:yes gene_type:complete
MATVDLTGGQGTGEFMPSRQRGVHVVEKTFDVAKLIADSTITAVTTGDVFQVIDVPAECYLLHAGAEVLTAFTGTSPTCDIDFAAGDDLVDGGDISSAGYLAKGTNGHVDYTAVATFSNRITATDTIDVKLEFTGGTMSAGKMRVYAILADISGKTEKQVHNGSASG